MTFEDFFKQCWFWYYHNEEANKYAIEVGVILERFNIYMHHYEVTKEAFSDLASKEIVARCFYDSLKKKNRI